MAGAQSKGMSFIEAIISTAIGFVVSFIANTFIFWFISIPITLMTNLSMVVFFTVVSVIRGYFVRRMFNEIHARQEGK